MNIEQQEMSKLSHTLSTRKTGQPCIKQSKAKQSKAKQSKGVDIVQRIVSINEQQ
jgi:hypothetical protein